MDLPEKDDGSPLSRLTAFRLQPDPLLRTAILFAIAGTTCRPAMAVYDQISRAAAARFPGVEPRWCFTSRPIRRKLAEQGAPVPDPEEALAALHAEGFARAVVLPLHLSDGMEFGELAETVSAWRHKPKASMQLALGSPLLTSETDWRRALTALLAELPAATAQQLSARDDQPASWPPDERIILVLHGSIDPRGAKTLARAVDICRAINPRLVPGMTLGKPDLVDVVNACRNAGVRKAWLLPCFVVAGRSSHEEIAGAGEPSWASTLRRAGMEVVPVVKALGEVDAIVQIWLDAVARLLAELAT